MVVGDQLHLNLREQLNGLIKDGIILDKGMGEFNKLGNDSWKVCKGFDYIMRDQFGYNHALQDKLFMTKNRDKFQRVIVKASC